MVGSSHDGYSLNGRRRIGAVGPKLLFEDDSIQHAGMYFSAAIIADRWLNQHFHKGMPRDFAPACEERARSGCYGSLPRYAARVFRELSAASPRTT